MRAKRKRPTREQRLTRLLMATCMALPTVRAAETGTGEPTEAAKKPAQTRESEGEPAGTPGNSRPTLEPEGAKGNGLARMSIEELMQLELPQVTGASKYQQDVSEAPASVSVVTAEDIKHYGHRTLADILASVRGLWVGNDRTYSYLGIRGFNRSGDYNGRVLLLVDGHRLNENIFDSTLIGQGFILDVDTIERVEVIRGPSSSLYGNNAFFGVINVVTKKGGEFDGVQGSVEAGSRDSYKLQGSVGKKLKNGLEFFLSGSYFDTQGDAKLDYDEFGATAVLRDWERAVNALGTITYSDFTLQGAYGKRTKGIPTAPFGTLFNAPNTQVEDSQAYVDLKFEREFGDGWDVLARANYNYYGYEGIYPYDNAPLPPILTLDEATGRWVGGEIQGSKSFEDRHKLIGGFEFRENLQQDQHTADQNPSFVYLDDERTSRFWGIYGQAEAGILDNLVLNAGLRYDHYSEFGDTLNPRVALIYHPSEKTTFKLLYGRAFRAPNAFEAYYNDGAIATTKANPSLEPETTETYEAVYEQHLPYNQWFTTSLYYYEMNDLITQVTDPADGLLVYRNISEVQAYGGELGLHGRYSWGGRTRLSYALQRAESKDTGRELSNSPRHLFKANFVMPVYEDKFLAGVELQYNSSVLLEPGRATTKMDDYFVVNATLFSQKLAKGLEWSLSVYNVFDNRHDYPGGGEHLQDLIEQRGREFRVKVTYKF